MRNLPWYLLFIFSATSGGFGSWLINKIKTKNKEKIDDIQDIEEGYNLGTCNHKIYYEIGAVDEKNNVVDDKDISRSTSNKSWTEADRKLLSKLVYNQEYDSKEMAKSEVDGDVLIFNNELESIDEKEHTIETIQAKAFVDAVANGQLMRSFIFDPSNKKFYWNFTGELLDDNEAHKLFGSEVVNEILLESDYNANGWIQPRYLHDVDDGCYYKIECGTRIQL